MRTPSHNGSVTGLCLVCSGPLPAGRPRTTCSAGCRQALWRHRHTSAAPAAAALIEERIPSRSRRAAAVYECPLCELRLVGEQRCECGSFMRRIGPGGRCPSCDEPVAIAELLNGEIGNRQVDELAGSLTHRPQRAQVRSFGDDNPVS